MSIHDATRDGAKGVQDLDSSGRAYIGTAASNSCLVGVAAGLASVPQGEPEVCEGCGGAGGVRCFACDGTGAMASTDDEANLSPAQQRKVGATCDIGVLECASGRHQERAACGQPRT